MAVLVGALVAALLAIVVAAVEIAERYRDDPFRTLLRTPSVAYLFVNAFAAVGAFALVRLFRITFGLPDDSSEWGVVLVQGAAAGLGAITLFRIRFFNVRNDSGDTVTVGPAALLDSLLGVLDRQVDRSRSDERTKTVTEALGGLTFARDHIALTHFAGASLSRMEDADADRLGKASMSLRDTPELTDHQRLICYGLDLLPVVGYRVLSSAAAHIRAEVVQTPIEGARRDDGARAEVWLSGLQTTFPSFPPSGVIPAREALEARLEQLNELEQQAAASGSRIDISLLLELGRVKFLLGRPEAATGHLAAATNVGGEAYKESASDSAASHYWLLVNWDALLWRLACSTPWSATVETIVLDFRRLPLTGDNRSPIRWHSACLSWLMSRFGPWPERPAEDGTPSDDVVQHFESEFLSICREAPHEIPKSCEVVAALATLSATFQILGAAFELQIEPGSTPLVDTMTSSRVFACIAESVRPFGHLPGLERSQLLADMMSDPFEFWDRNRLAHEPLALALSGSAFYCQVLDSKTTGELEDDELEEFLWFAAAVAHGGLRLLVDQAFSLLRSSPWGTLFASDDWTADAFHRVDTLHPDESIRELWGAEMSDNPWTRLLPGPPAAAPDVPADETSF